MKLTLNPKRLAIINNFFLCRYHVYKSLVNLQRSPQLPPTPRKTFHYTLKTGRGVRGGGCEEKREEGKKTKIPALIPGKFCSEKK